MDSPPDPSSVPLPMSTVGSPETYTTPLQSPRMSNTRWFADRSLQASPTNSPLPPPRRPIPPPPISPTSPLSPFPLSADAIDIVPPTPPELSRPVDIGETDAPTLPHPTPRSIVSNISESKRRSHRYSRSMVMDRMSRSFHTGTPPPAIVRLRGADDVYSIRQSGAYSRRPVSNVYVRGDRSDRGGGDGSSNGGDSRRSSIVSQQGSRSRRQSVASLIRQFERGGSGKRARKVPTYESAPPPPVPPLPPHAHLQSPSRPPPPPPTDGEEIEELNFKGKQKAGGQHPDAPMSDDTHVATGSGTPEGSPNAHASSTAESTEALSMSLVDPLTVLERRRRRDFTIGSHHPLHGPPNTPASLPRRRLTESSRREFGVTQPGLESNDIIEGGDDEGDGESVDFDQFDYLVAKFRRIWTRIGDMPWVADPCVATLIIPKTSSADGGGGDGESTSVRLYNTTPWYRPRPSLDELLDGGPMQQQRRRNGSNDNNLSLDTLGQSPSQSPLQRPRRQRQRSDATAASTTVENDGTSMETIVTPTSPTRKKGVWHPRMPEPIAQRMGKERFGDALVIRGLRRMSS